MASTSTRQLLLSALATAGALAASAAPAHAANAMNCDASAFRGQLLTAPALEPAAVNRGAAACTDTASPTALDLTSLVPLTAGALSATTRARGTGTGQQALAMGGLSQLRVGALPTLPLPDLFSLIPANLLTVNVPLSSIRAAANVILTPLGLALPTSIDVDISGAVRSLVQGLPNLDVLRVGGATAYAGASCQDGVAVPFGTAQLANVSVLGQDVGTDGLVDDALQVLAAQSIDPSQLLIDAIVLPKVVTDLGLNSLTRPILDQVKGVVASVVGALPPIPVPAALAQVSIVPRKRTVEGGVVTQHALDVRVALLGQTLVDATIGEARVNVTGVDCAPATKPTATKGPTATTLALQCTNRRVTLTDVFPAGRRVRLLGAANPALAGKRVTVRFEATGRTVAHAVVAKDGSFTTTAPLPSARLRATNRARYLAIVDGHRSLNLKLARRMQVTTAAARDGRVTISGRISGPLGDPIQPITVQRRLSCKTLETVKTFLPRRDGTFSVTLPAPSGQRAAVYRLGTTVRKTAGSSKLFPTFTLPRAVDLT